jgi:hypothetical protein
MMLRLAGGGCHHHRGKLGGWVSAHPPAGLRTCGRFFENFKVQAVSKMAFFRYYIMKDNPERERAMVSTDTRYQTYALKSGVSFTRLADNCAQTPTVRLSPHGEA